MLSIAPGCSEVHDQVTRGRGIGAFRRGLDVCAMHHSRHHFTRLWTMHTMLY